MHHIINFLTAASATTFAGAFGSALATAFDIPGAFDLTLALMIASILLALPIIGKE